MRDILAACGMPVDEMTNGKLYDPGLQHAEFESYDEDETGARYHARSVSAVVCTQALHPCIGTPTWLPL